MEGPISVIKNSSTGVYVYICTFWTRTALRIQAKIIPKHN